LHRPEPDGTCPVRQAQGTGSDRTRALVAALYIRVSGEEQRRGYSMDAQKEDLLRWAERMGWQVHAVYEDPARTARYLEDRIGYRNMMQAVRAGMIDAIAVVDTDRLHRNVANEEAMYQELMRLGVKLFSLDERGEVELDTARGRRDARRKAVDDAYYSERLSERTTRGKKQRAQDGLWNGHPPFGYCRGDCHTCTDPNGPDYCLNYGGMPLGDGRHLVAHPKDSEGVRLAFELYATGEHSDTDVAVALNDAGYRTNNKYTKKPNPKRKGGPRPFTKDTVRDVLRNQTYLGLVKYKDELFPGKHPPLVSRALFDACQAVRKAKGRARKMARGGDRSRIYLLAGLLYCGECGGKLHSAASGRKHRYYRCYRSFQEPGACSQTSATRADLLEEEVELAILDLELPEDWQRQINGYLNGGPDLEQVERQRRVLEAKLERIKRLYIDGDLNDGEYRRERGKVRRELARLVTPEAVNIENAAAMLRNFSGIWDQATLVEKKKILHEILGRIVVRDKEIVELIPSPAFVPLFNRFRSKERTTGY
jgi:site-specific DNA recombinase